jgi:hypothetical protein
MTAAATDFPSDDSDEKARAASAGTNTTPQNGHPTMTPIAPDANCNARRKEAATTNNTWLSVLDTPPTHHQYSCAHSDQTRHSRH